MAFQLGMGIGGQWGQTSVMGKLELRSLSLSLSLSPPLSILLSRSLSANEVDKGLQGTRGSYYCLSKEEKFAEL